MQIQLSTICRQMNDCSFQGVVMARYFSGRYSGPDDRSKHEKRDKSMLPSDIGVANMPQSEVYMPWFGSPTLTPINAPEGLNDSREGVDQQIMQDLGMKKAPSAMGAAHMANQAGSVAGPQQAHAMAAAEVEEKEKGMNPSPF